MTEVKMTELKARRALRDLGIDVGLKGHELILMSVEYGLSLSKEETLWGKQLYHWLGEQTDSSHSSVERRMRHAIQKASDRPTKLYTKLFGAGKAENLRFISTVIEYIRFPEVYN